MRFSGRELNVDGVVIGKEGVGWVFIVGGMSDGDVRVLWEKMIGGRFMGDCDMIERCMYNLE